MKNIISLIGREFNLFFKNKVLLVLFLGAPILYGVLIGNVYKKGNVTDVPIVVVDEDNTTMSHKVINMLEDNESVKVVAVLPSTFDSKNIALQKDAEVVVVIPRNFQSDIQQKKYPEITYFIDASNTLTSNTAAIAITTVLTTLKAGITIETSRKQGMPEYVASHSYEPFRTTMIRQNIRSGNYLYFMLPGVLLTVLQQILLLGLALSFSSEYENNTFKDLVKRSGNPFTLIFVKVFPYVLMSVFIYGLYYGYGEIFNMKLEAPFTPFFYSSLVFVLAVCFIGILVSVFLSYLYLESACTAIAVISGSAEPFSQKLQPPLVNSF